MSWQSFLQNWSRNVGKNIPIGWETYPRRTETSQERTNIYKLWTILQAIFSWTDTIILAENDGNSSILCSVDRAAIFMFCWPCCHLYVLLTVLPSLCSVDRAVSLCSVDRAAIFMFCWLCCIFMFCWPFCHIYVLLTVLPSRYNSCKWPAWCTILLSICLFQFSTCFLPVTSCSSSGESIVSIHLVCVILCRWPSCAQIRKDLHTRRSPTQWHIPDVVLIQLILLMMSTRLFETCRELKWRYRKKNCASSWSFTKFFNLFRNSWGEIGKIYDLERRYSM
jgi:hypothetical protein